MFKDKEIKNDKYFEKYQFIYISIQIFYNSLNGNFVNFAVLEVYEDKCFIELARCIFWMVIG